MKIIMYFLGIQVSKHTIVMTLLVHLLQYQLHIHHSKVLK